MTKKVSSSAIAEVFNQCFDEAKQNVNSTRVVTGASEPLYVPANLEAEFSEGTAIKPVPYARVFSRLDYPASVLHEVAHWCVAGSSRRQLLDYGYWYEPDGRSLEQQALFESVEVKPQALERIMSRAAGVPFRVSADNVADPLCKPSESFKQAVHSQTLDYLNQGLPDRAAVFISALETCFLPEDSALNLSSYVLGDLL